MEYLHSLNIIHRNLNGSSIILCGSNYSSMISVIVDFSSAKFIDSENTGNVGSPCFMAPEIIHECDYDLKADVFSYSIILYQLLTNKNPYPKMHWTYAYLRMLKGERLEIPAQYENSKFTELIKSCWAENPQKRLSFTDIVNQSGDLCFPDCDNDAFNDLMDEMWYQL